MNARVTGGSAVLFVGIPVALGFAACSGHSAGGGKNDTSSGSAQGGCELQSCGTGMVLERSSCSCVPDTSGGGSGGGGGNGSGGGGSSGGSDAGCGRTMSCMHGSHWDDAACNCVIDPSSSDGGCQYKTMPCVSGAHWDTTACQCVSDSDAGNGCIFGNGLNCAPGEHWDANECQCVSNEEPDAAAASDAGCVQNTLCMRGFHWDSSACLCVADPDTGSPMPLPEAGWLPEAGTPQLIEAGPLPEAGAPPDAGTVHLPEAGTQSSGLTYPEAGSLPYPEAGFFQDAGVLRRPDSGSL
jgi:hypothetical protein